MGGRRVRGSERRRSLRAWTIAADLLGVVVALTWVERVTSRSASKTGPGAGDGHADAAPAPTAIATRVVAPTKRPAPTPTATIPPPEPTAVWTAVPTVRRTPTRPRRVVVPPPPAPPRRPVEPAPDEVEVPLDRPRVEATEKPSVGSDLQDATRAYSQAVETHNARVDEYNSLADEIQRRNAWDDSEVSVELRRRLDRAREAVESARVQAEMLRARMESVRTRYR
jgi:hypothetical protein